MTIQLEVIWNASELPAKVSLVAGVTVAKPLLATALLDAPLTLDTPREPAMAGSLVRQ